jgi:hypothetical protein
LSRVNNRNKSVVETDFVQGTGWYIELVRTTNFPLALVLYKIAGEKVTVGTQFRLGDRVFVPPEEDELTRHVHFAHSYGDYDSVGSLLQQIDSLISRCLDLDAGHRFLLAALAKADLRSETRSNEPKNQENKIAKRTPLNHMKSVSCVS